jgi:flagellar basal-body rod protein FlgF
MLYGLYHSAQGAQTQAFRLDVLANNMANASTNAFKRDLALFQSHRPYEVENGGGTEPPGNQNALSGGTTAAEVVTDFSQGSLHRTAGPLDVALRGEGFFQVSDGNRQYLTRNGEFGLNAGGELIALGSGMRVMSNSGQPITIPSDAKTISISRDGTITGQQADGVQNTIAKLGLVRPATQQQLKKVGNSLYAANGSVAPAGPELHVQQGYTEASGVNPVGEMLDLIQASRAVEANVNMIKFQDDTLDRLLQTAGGR